MKLKKFFCAVIAFALLSSFSFAAFENPPLDSSKELSKDLSEQEISFLVKSILLADKSADTEEADSSEEAVEENQPDIDELVNAKMNLYLEAPEAFISSLELELQEKSDSEINTILENYETIYGEYNDSLSPSETEIDEPEEELKAPESFVEAASEIGKELGQQTSSFLAWVKSWANWKNLFKLIGALAICFLIWGIYRLILHFFKKIPETKISAQASHVVSKILKYSFYIILVIYILSQCGVKLSAVWGAAGITGVAIGFAAQTALSNIISGVFVLTEKSIKVGDMIIVGDVTGVVDSINLLSVRVHTLDNQMVRIPNSTIINSNFVNNSYHKSRRITIDVSIAYDTDMTKALTILLSAPALCPHVLTDPAPAAWYSGFGESGINLTLAVWFDPATFIEAKNETYIAIKKVFDDAGIEIPFNQLDVNFPQKNGASLKITTK